MAKAGLSSGYFQAHISEQMQVKWLELMCDTLPFAVNNGVLIKKQCSGLGLARKNGTANGHGHKLFHINFMMQVLNIKHQLKFLPG